MLALLVLRVPEICDSAPLSGGYVLGRISLGGLAEMVLHFLAHAP